jgi:hypothetical protein
MTTLRTSERENDCLMDLSRSSSSRSRRVTRVGGECFQHASMPVRSSRSSRSLLLRSGARPTGRPRRWAIRQRSVLPGSRSRATRQTKLVSAMARPWANVRETVAAHLYKPKGIFLGVPRGDAYLRHDGPDHVMRVAPTRSGKGSCFADGSGPDLVGDHARHHGRELAVHHEMAVDGLPFACCSIRSIRTTRGTTRCSKCAGVSDSEVVYGAMRRSLSS